MRDLLMTFKTFKKYCVKWDIANGGVCDILYQWQCILSSTDKRCHCNKKNCPVVKRTRL